MATTFERGCVVEFVRLMALSSTGIGLIIVPIKRLKPELKQSATEASRLQTASELARESLRDDDGSGENTMPTIAWTLCLVACGEHLTGPPSSWNRCHQWSRSRTLLQPIADSFN